ncbi:putative quinol monooxygenase [Kitasatospora sp. NPDC088391]|uniref:putative quinol monooxygenase n=1 Tax=Kitasatospora sp. NPDC088391 TaxID=3364074 RepID=UPI0037FA35C5
MITCTTVLDVAEGREAEFEELLTDLVLEVRANEPGTPFFELVRSRTAPRRYLVVEQYADEAAFAAHARTDYLARFVPRMLPLLTGDPVIDSYDPVA